ncbi:MAG: holo-ACP synthase [Holosporales bacterium]|jgi:holo-[acyl-carrier protein] synthase|nr:holo-ACP synthase [Holosporales bacterium]
MIIGVGTDIVDIRRIAAAIGRHGDRFLERIFTRSEINFCRSRLLSIESFAKIFAAKEAIIKAISYTNGMTWHDIEVLHEKNGRPYAVLAGAALRNIRSNDFHINISISDEKNYAIAFAIIEG